MHSKTAVLIPGQGTPLEGVSDWVKANRPDLFESVVEAAGEDPFARATESTRFAQPSMVCASLALWGTVTPAVEADALLGHSLGEITALAIAGVLSETDALKLAAARGAAMDAAGNAAPGGMAAVRRLELDAVKALAADHGLAIACDNAPGQIILAGTNEALDAASEAAGKGKLRRLEVSAAFHSPLMIPATEELSRALDQATFSDAKVEVWSGVTAAPIDDPRQRILDSLTHPVLYRPALLNMYQAGFRNFVDIGPGDVVAGLASKTLGEQDDVTVQAVGKNEVVSGLRSYQREASSGLDSA